MKFYNHTNINYLAKYIPKNSGVFVIIDKNVTEYFPKNRNFHFIPIDANERNKSLEYVYGIYKALIGFGADRDCFIIGVGGGVTTDITGFVASTYKRGVRFGFVPTTLLAQVDAAIGGKNGVNFSGYKNMIGTINQPEWIYVTTTFLRSLDERVFREGIAEMLKTFMIFDKGSYYEALAMAAVYKNKMPAAWQERELRREIALCGEMKMRLVAEDEKDRGSRRLLNLGHTFAHSIEAAGAKGNKAKGAGSFGVLHGEAVSMGMVIAAKVAEKLSLCTEKFVKELSNDLTMASLPVSCPVTATQLFSAIKADKKRSGEKICLILPKSIGRVVKKDIELKELQKVLREINY